MLNGLDPIIIFNFKKLPVAATGEPSIPLVADIIDALPLPSIPIYLSERLTGIYIDSEEKNVDVQTDTETLSDGKKAEFAQKGIQSAIRINMVASRDSIGVSLLSAMADLAFQKVTSKEYSITYLHGAVTVFGGLLQQYSVNQNSNDDRYNITLELIKPTATSETSPTPTITPVEPVEAEIPLDRTIGTFSP